MAFEDLTEPPLIAGDIELKEDALPNASAQREVYVCGVGTAV
jgi:hypothetical protein